MVEQGVYMVQQYADEKWIFAVWIDNKFYLFGNEIGFKKSKFKKVGKYLGKEIQ
jgi:hypothetical protein